MGVNDHGPHETNYEEEMIWSIHSMSISAITKLEIIQCAVTRSPKVCISAHRIHIPSLLDLGSDVTLLMQLYFEKHLLPKIQGQLVKRLKLINYSISWLPMMGSFQ